VEFVRHGDDFITAPTEVRRHVRAYFTDTSSSPPPAPPPPALPGQPHTRPWPPCPRTRGPT
jgi:hypothetical protein